jgi:diguanylate cyclase (GGDEF)-like protein
MKPVVTIAAASIRSQLNRLVALCLLPVFGWGAAWLFANPVRAAAGRLPASTATITVPWWWALASVVLLVAGLALAERLARRLTRSAQLLAETAARLADELPVVAPNLPVKEAEEIAAALIRAAALLRERTAERDRAARAEQRLRRDYRQLERRATHDALTGLINRAYFDTLIRGHVAECRRGKRHLTVLYIDVDGFKRINDLHGHAVGDELLRLFAARLKAGVRRSEVVARLGGDEFAVLIDHVSQDAALTTADTLIDRLSRPYLVGTSVVEVSASIGIAGYPSSGSSAHALLRAADEAMYRAKRAGKCRYESGFTPL